MTMPVPIIQIAIVDRGFTAHISKTDMNVFQEKKVN